jgi:hypothetical protein
MCSADCLTQSPAVTHPAARVFGFAEAARPAASASALAGRPAKLHLQPENVRNGLAQLVLTLVELLRELLERQAVRRMDADSLSSAEVERLGTTFLQLSAEIDRLKEYFGFTDDDLNLDLGPLGKLR